MFKFKKFLAVTTLTGVLFSTASINAYADDEGLEEALKVAGAVEGVKTVIHAVTAPEVRERAVQGAVMRAALAEASPIVRALPEPVARVVVAYNAGEGAVGGAIMGAIESVIKEATQH